MSYLDDNMCREIIMDHISTPRNKNKKHDGYLEYTLKNPSCGDIVTVYIDYQNNIVNDITYNVEGCSICTSSTSIMSDLLKAKTKEEIEMIINNFNNMLIGEKYSEELLNEASALRGVYNTPPRIKCAALPYKAVEEIIGDNNG